MLPEALFGRKKAFRRADRELKPSCNQALRSSLKKS